MLDWEMATIGDPLMDLGTALGYWVEPDDPPVFQVMQSSARPTAPGNLTRMEFVERWSKTTGRDASNVLFYYVFALFKLAVVAQQLYKRYIDGLTKEDRYAVMLEGVRAVAAAALVAIDKGASIAWEPEPRYWMLSTYVTSDWTCAAVRVVVLPCTFSCPNWSMAKPFSPG